MNCIKAATAGLWEPGSVCGTSARQTPRPLNCTKTLIMHDHQKLWLDLEGNLHPVPDSHSHEEWANEHGHELEDLLAQGWCRIQITHAYLYIDFKVRLNAAQAKAVGTLLEGRNGQVVVEFGGESRSFEDGVEAMTFLLAIE